MSDLNVTRGDDRSFTTTVTDEDGEIVDLTGVTAAEWTLKRDKADPTPILARSLGSGVTIAAPLTGEVKTDLTATQTSTLSGSYVWDLQLTAGGKVYTPDQGRLYVTGDVTGAGYPEEPTLSVAQFREAYTTPVSDTVIQQYIDANTEAIESLVGAHGSLTERLVGGTTYLLLHAPAGSITTVSERSYASIDAEVVLDPSDWFLGHDGTYLQRVADGLTPAHVWGNFVDVTYVTLEQVSDRRRVLIALTKLDCSHDPAYTSMTIGDASYSFATYREARDNLLASLLPAPQWSFA